MARAQRRIVGQLPSADTLPPTTPLPRSDEQVGPDAAEIMQGMGVTVKMGVTKAQLDSVVGIHPSAAEEFVTMRSVSRRIRAKQLVAA